MKIVIVLTAVCFATSHALTCSTTGTRGSPPRKCPNGMQCKITYKGRPEVDIPNRGTCVKKTSGGNSLACGAESSAVCMGYNIKCFKSTLVNCKAQCKKTNGCKMAEYAKGSRTCCTSKYDSKSNCPGSFTTSSSWKGYRVCPATSHSANYNKAYAAFDAADHDHSGTVTFGGAYQALSKLFPDASEQTLEHLTKTADKAHYDNNKHRYIFRDGKIDKSEFITMYLSLLRQKQHGSSDPCKNSSACGYGQTCYRCRSTKGFCCKKIVTMGPHEKPNGGLSKSELARVTNLFQAMNTHKSSATGALANEYLTYSELFAFLRKTASAFGTRSNIYHQVTNLVVHSDQDHNSRVSFKEFVSACGKLKASDPKAFAKFLSEAESKHALPVGSSCMPTGSTKCAKGSSCLPVSHPPRIMDGMRGRHADGHLMVPGNPLSGGRRTLALSRSTKYTCQKKSTACEACVKSKGKWFGSHCIGPGGPMVYDAPMISSVAGCRKKVAMDEAKCSQYKSCGLCTSRGKDRTLGQLCAWSSAGSSGRCVQNQGGGFFGPPRITAASMCHQDVVHVHG